MLETPFLLGADREDSQGVGKQEVSQQFGGVLYRAVAQYEAPQCESRWERRLAWGKAVATKLGEQLGVVRCHFLTMGELPALTDLPAPSF